MNFNVNFNVINRASVGEIKRNFGNIKIRGKTMQKKKTRSKCCIFNLVTFSTTEVHLQATNIIHKRNCVKFYHVLS